MNKFFNKLQRSKTIKIILMFMIFINVVSFSITVLPQSAMATCCKCRSCNRLAFNTDIINWVRDEITITVYIWIKIMIHQWIWFDLVYWQQHMLPLFMNIGNQLGSVGAFQVMVIGEFIDAQQQLEAQRDLQIMHARTHKDYHTSKGMCEFATRIQSLVASERKGEANALILSERSTDRLLGNVDVAAWSGTNGDVLTRLGAFQKDFCETFDNNNSLSVICPQLKPPLSGAQKSNLNKDIDYQRFIEDPWTIDFDLTLGGDPSKSDTGVIAMANNLYGFEVFDRAKHEALFNFPEASINDAQSSYLNFRSLVAKIKVAENSFNALMAMKGEGTSGSKDYLKAYLEELGMDSGDVIKFLGKNPSYNAQMEILTKKAYQSPLFYTNLYDKPANVERKGAAMQAIGLIQKFDLLKSYLRTEASLSVLLELSVAQLQRQVETNISALDKRASLKMLK